MQFTPYPEDAEVVDSFDDIDIDPHDPAEDGDDSIVESTAPGLIGRIKDKLST